MAQGETVPPQEIHIPPTPWWWRAAMAAAVIGLAGAAYGLREIIGPQGVSAYGVVCLIGIAACFSKNLRAVNWRTIGWGLLLQVLLAVFILKWEIYGVRPGYALFEALGDAVRKFIDFSNVGAEFVFSKLADRSKMEEILGPNNAVVVAFQVLPPIIFVSSFFSILYYFGILQFVVRLMARLMMYLMKTSGAETLSASANVFMGQAEAPLIVKPYINHMTQSELLALMAGGMATIAGAVLVAYVNFGADRVALLATSVMAAPCGLYLSKLVLPEMEQPETGGVLTVSEASTHANAIDAAAAGAADGLKLALNVGAMLIAFLALLAMIDYLLMQMATGQSLLHTLHEATDGMNVLNLFLIGLGFVAVCLIANRMLISYRPDRPLYKIFGTGTFSQRAGNVAFVLVLFVLFVVGLNYLLAWLPEHLQLKHIFATIFSPLAFLIGVPQEDVPAIANLLGTKIAANEFVAFVELKSLYTDRLAADLSPLVQHRSHVLASYALTGFANFGSVGIQIGGIGALAPERRSDLARLGIRAMMVGFLATLINAAIAGTLSDFSVGPD